MKDQKLTDTRHTRLKCYQLQFNFPRHSYYIKKMRLGIGNSIPSWSASSEIFLFIWSTVCLQNTFWTIALEPLETQKNYASQCVEHQKPIILYLKHFVLHQLFVYLLAKIKMKKEKKFFKKLPWSKIFFFSYIFVNK